MTFLTSLLGYCSLTAATGLLPRQDAVFQPGAETGISLGGTGAGGLANTPDRAEQDEQQALFATAGKNANLSSSATFQYGYPAGAQDDSTWTWRVNITNVDLSPLEDPSTQGQYSTNVYFDLQWPEGGTLRDYLSGHRNYSTGQESTLCAARWSYSYPANVTSRYSANDNGNCSSVLGAQCAASLLSALQAGGPCARLFNSSYSEVLAGCEDTYDVTSRGVGAAQNLGNSTETFFNYQNESVVAGGPIYFVTYQPLPPTNLSHFDAAQTYLNMLYLSGGGSGNFKPALLCQVVTPPTSSGMSISWSSSRRLVGVVAGVVIGVTMWL